MLRREKVLPHPTSGTLLPMNRERLAWITSTLVIAGLALSLPGAAAQRDGDFRFTGTLAEVHRWVGSSYVRHIDREGEEKLKEAAIAGMLSQLDEHTLYFPPDQQDQFKLDFEGQLTGIGVTLLPRPDGLFEVESPMDESPAAKAGIQAGDVVVEVDHKSVIGRDFATLGIRGEAGTKVTLTLQRDGRPVDVTVVRADVQRPTVTGYDRNADQTWNYFPIPGERVGYVRVSQFTDRTADHFERALRDMDPAKLGGLVIDLRDNGGGFVDQAAAMADLFLPADALVVTTRDRDDRPTVRRASQEGLKLPAFPVVILVNDNTASASEIFSGALSDNRRATLVGTRTYGKGSVQEIHPLSDGGKLKITVALYYLPSGRMIHRLPNSTTWGVDPQVLVPVGKEVRESIAVARKYREDWRRPGQTGPATRATDPQLDEALHTVVSMNVMREARK